jgi:hypothetical protein
VHKATVCAYDGCESLQDEHRHFCWQIQQWEHIRVLCAVCSSAHGIPARFMEMAIVNARLFWERIPAV